MPVGKNTVSKVVRLQVLLPQSSPAVCPQEKQQQLPLSHCGVLRFVDSAGSSCLMTAVVDKALSLPKLPEGSHLCRTTEQANGRVWSPRPRELLPCAVAQSVCGSRLTLLTIVVGQWFYRCSGHKRYNLLG